MSKRLNMSNDEAVEWLLSLKNLDICGENRKTAIDKAVTALKAQPCIEDYPTCTECEHYDKEKHYCPRFCQVIKDTLAEAQPCEDCISRQAVLDGIDKYIEKTQSTGTKDDFISFQELVVKQLPSVKPKYTDEEIDKAQAVEQAYVDKMVELAVEETKRPKGKWEYVERDTFGYFIYKCSNCNKQSRIRLTNYCPNCGAEMSGGGEDEDGKSL